MLISRIRIIILDVRGDPAKTVLIVDSQPREATALQKQLAFAGFKTEIATTGAGAIKIVEEHPPDIVLVEASLSDADSIEVVAFIRSDLRTRRLPVLAMSVFVHMKDRCLKGGCDDFVQKPIKILDLVARIRKALRWPKLSTKREGASMLTPLFKNCRIFLLHGPDDNHLNFVASGF